MQRGGMDRRRRSVSLFSVERRSYLLHITAGWGWGCWSRGASSDGSKGRRGHVVSKGMVELLDLEWRSDASGLIVLESA